MLLNKIARAMEGPAADGSILGLEPIDITYLNDLTEHLTSLLKSFEVKFSSETFTLTKRFWQLTRDTLLVNQPLLKESVLDMYLVKSKDTYKVVRKEERADPPSQVNFAFIVYSFLVVLRDYLNTSENTVSAQCPLPLILHKASKK